MYKLNNSESFFIEATNWGYRTLQGDLNVTNIVCLKTTLQPTSVANHKVCRKLSFASLQN